MMSLDQMTKDLNLTPDQVSKIQAIQANSRTQRQAIMADKSLTRDVKRTRLMDLAKSTRDQIMAVLTPEQQAKLQELRAQRKTEMYNRMSAELGLTADQQTQIKAIMDKKQADMAAVRADTSLTPEAKVARIKEIRDASMAQIRALLTPEQQAKLDAMHKNVKARKAGAAGTVRRAGSGPAVIAPVQPNIVQPNVVQPNVVQPYVAQPGMGPSTVQPNLVQPNVVQPYPAQPGMGPTLTTPYVTQPNIIQPAQPGMGPSTIQPGVVQPNVIQPNVVQPNVVQPSYVPTTVQPGCPCACVVPRCC
jgi:Spy/CpxP family protein refolding chaperone